jgi:two-component system sensor histidine kinase/response regulator
MDAPSGSAPVGDARGAAGPAAEAPPPAHVAVLDASGVIVAADDRWAAAAREEQSTICALGNVGARYHDACEARARSRPQIAPQLMRLADAVRKALAGGGEQSFSYAVGDRSYGARVIPVRGAGADHTLVALTDTTGYRDDGVRHELRRRFEALFDSLDVAVLVQDVEGRALASNASAERILGLSADQLAGREPVDPRWALLHEDGWPLPPDSHPGRVALRTRRPCRDMAVGVKHPDGRVTWTAVNAQPLVREPGERPYAVALAFRDVTHVRNADVAERRTQDRFRSLIEYSSDVITIVDERARVTYESASAEAVLGYAPGELGRGPERLALIHPDDVGAAVNSITALIGTPGESASCEYRLRSRDGRWRVLESMATNRLHDPAVLGIVINTRDVTERREAEAALRATSSRLENLVQNLHAGVLVEDAERRIAVVNADYCAIFGLEAPQEELLGAGPGSAVRATRSPVSSPERFEARIAELVRARLPVHGEEVAFDDGRTFERDYIPVSRGRDDRGHLWIYRDISRRKESEREAARLRDEAIRASRLKSEFLATMSHEIRTPMNGVIGTIELLLDAQLEPHQRDLAALARDSAAGLLAIVNDALDLSKIEAEKLEPRDADLELASMTEGVADVVLSAARRRGLALSVYVDPRITGKLRGDSQWLRQVLVNLAGNAVKFTDRGEVRIRAELEEQTARSAVVRFSVSDTGIGIRESARDRLFEPFAQLDSTTTRRHGGTGLGLAICQRLVRLMGGEIDVDSHPGRGSTFSFALALRRGASVTANIAARGVRVLVAEPRETVAAIACDYLDAWGIDCERAATTEEACALVATAAGGGRPFGVAVLGTGAAGEEESTAAALRATAGAERLALVLLKEVGAPTSWPDDMFVRELTRPLKQSHLYEAVLDAAGLLGGSPPAEADESPPAALPPGMRVLVAEDNEVNRELLVRQLARLGVDCDAVSTGTAAVDAVRRRPYDAVLMDFHMPEVDGVQAARAIRALPGGRGSTPVVAVTAGGSPAEREACVAAGMDDFLPKPVSSRALARALGRVIEGAPRPAQPDAAPAIDADTIDRLDADLGGRVELRRIAGIYLAQLGPGVQAIADAVRLGDSEALRRAAHRLCSASETFGAVGVSELSGRMERLGGSGGVRDAAALVPALVEESARAGTELRALLDQP